MSWPCTVAPVLPLKRGGVFLDALVSLFFLFLVSLTCTCSLLANPFPFHFFLLPGFVMHAPRISRHATTQNKNKKANLAI